MLYHLTVRQPSPATRITNFTESHKLPRWATGGPSGENGGKISAGNDPKSWWIRRNGHPPTPMLRAEKHRLGPSYYSSHVQCSLIYSFMSSIWLNESCYLWIKQTSPRRPKCQPCWVPSAHGLYTEFQLFWDGQRIGCGRQGKSFAWLLCTNI